MGRILILLVVALGLALYIPESREMIAERTRPLANPAYRWMTHQQMNQIVEDLELHVGTGRQLPLARGEFDTWLNQRYRQARSRSDSWGTRYQLRVRGNNFEVISAGPDGQFGTDDDLVRTGTVGPSTRR